MILALTNFSVRAQSKLNHHQNILGHKVDSIMEDAIKQRAFPGAQVLIYKDDAIRLNRAYGYHTYDSIQMVTTDDLFDLASVTKILAGTLAFMKLYELYDIDLNAPVSKYIPLLKKGNKKETTFIDVLTHSSGWKSGIKRHLQLFRKNGKIKPGTISSKRSKRFPYQISDAVFVHKKYFKTIIKRIRDSELEVTGQYKYSGLWFFLLPELVESLSGMTIDVFLNRHFYAPMNLDRISFRPMSRFPKNQIVPTEIDTLFRKGLVQGWVHDEAAALMGKISTNAGLFANAQTLSPLLEMLLNKGKYKGTVYLKPETVKLFTSKTFTDSNNRRGLGFDKPILKLDEPQTYPSQWASPESYGHSGFTGILVWVDPKCDCFMIFLSNRVYPFRDQSTIYKLNVRSKVLDEAILN